MMKTNLGLLRAFKLLIIFLLSISILACGGNYNHKGDPAEIDRLRWGYSPQIAAIMEDLYLEGELNAVLNLSRLGQAAFHEGHLELAGSALDQAIVRIESVYADNPGAESARSKFTSEGTKDFKGEPYERSMVYFYRGLVDLALGDYDNARASFLAGEFQDTLSEQEEYRSDFSLLTWLAGWASHCGGQSVLAEDYFDQAYSAMQQRRNSLWSDGMHRWVDPLMVHPSDSQRTLVVGEWGSSPEKLAEGDYNEMLTFLRLPSSGGRLIVTPAGSSPDISSRSAAASSLVPPGSAGMYEWTHYQAMTRGGRPIDGILEGQARFKEGAETVGEVSSAVGTNMMMQGVLSGNNDLSAAGGAFALVGLLSSAIATSSKPEADTRRWARLPGVIAAASSPIGLEDPLDVNFLGIGTSLIPLDPVLDQSSDECRLVYTVRGGADRAPDPRLARFAIQENEFSRTMRRNAARDQQFRQQVLAVMTHQDYQPPAPELIESNVSQMADTASDPGKLVADRDLDRGESSRSRTAPTETVVAANPVRNDGDSMVSPARSVSGQQATVANDTEEARPGQLDTASDAYPRLDLNALWSDVDLSEPGESEKEEGRR